MRKRTKIFTSNWLTGEKTNRNYVFLSLSSRRFKLAKALNERFKGESRGRESASEDTKNKEIISGN